MEAKGEMPQEDGTGTIILYQCPKCKKAELVEKCYNSWFNLDYP